MGETTRLTNLTTGGPVHVDVKDGKIIRILPLQMATGDGAPWSIAARGREFTPPAKNTLSNWTVAHKSTIYSPQRILTPLKRVDFDPKGDRNLKNRGVSGYEPIGWDHAADLVAEEMIRLKREYGPAATMTTCSCGATWATGSAPTTVL
jgi:anaerobic selenocysteine-containing dehydrogenase